MPLSKKKRKIGFKNLILYLLIFSGISTSIYGFYIKYRSRALSFSQEPVFIESIKNEYSIPANINIENAPVTIPVVPSKIIDGVWQVSDSFANYLDVSGKPGEGENIIIYGHNKKEIFGNLLNRDLIGEMVEITTEDNNKYYYEITEKLTVSPSEMSVVEPTDYEVLTIYTCTGFLDSKRLVIKAIPIN